jgi:hypothetical protein
LIDVEVDHLVVAADTLGRGADFIEQKLGVRPQPGGKHLTMGTHNALIGLGKGLYIEVIAIDPAAKPPGRPRWFDLDDPRMKAELAESPRLIHFVARASDLDAAVKRCPMPLGDIETLSRGPYSWRMTVPADGRLPGRGLVPTLIQWSGKQHPADFLPDVGMRLTALAGEHPDPASVRQPLAALRLSDTFKVTYGRSPRIAAMLRTRKGIVTL